MLPLIAAGFEALGGPALLATGARMLPFAARVAPAVQRFAGSSVMKELGGALIPRNAAGRVAMGPAVLNSLNDIASTAFAVAAAPEGASLADRFNIGLQAGLINTAASALGEGGGAVAGGRLARMKGHLPGSDVFHGWSDAGRLTGGTVTGFASGLVPIPALNQSWEQAAQRQQALTQEPPAPAANGIVPIPAGSMGLDHARSTPTADSLDLDRMANQMAMQAIEDAARGMAQPTSTAFRGTGIRELDDPLTELYGMMRM